MNNRPDVFLKNIKEHSDIYNPDIQNIEYASAREQWSIFFSVMQ